MKETCRKTVTWPSIHTNREERCCVIVSGRSKRGGDQHYKAKRNPTESQSNLPGPQGRRTERREKEELSEWEDPF